jgi:Na+/H+ antiporter NhaC
MKGISFEHFFANINDQIITPLIYLIFTLALLYFLYNVFVYIQNAESPDKRIEGAKGMMWGIIGLFIMLSVKGIINLILRTIGAI